MTRRFAESERFEGGGHGRGDVEGFALKKKEKRQMKVSGGRDRGRRREGRTNHAWRFEAEREELSSSEVGSSSG